MFIGIIGWAILGLIIGFIGSKMVNLRGDDPAIGIALAGLCAVIGGWLYSTISGSPVTAFNLWSILFAVLAAGVGLAIWHGMRARAASRP